MWELNLEMPTRAWVITSEKFPSVHFSKQIKMLQLIKICQKNPQDQKVWKEKSGQYKGI